MTKKRFITLLIAIVMVVTLLTGCGKEEKTKTKPRKSFFLGFTFIL